MIKAGFILLTIALAAVVFAGLSIASNKLNDPRKQMMAKRNTILLLAGWLIYITILSLSGIFASTSLPPRIPLLLVLPPFLFTAWFFASGRFSNIIAAVPASWLVYAQSFRILVELLLHGMFLNGLLPRAATFHGYNFDIVIGITSLFIGYFGYTKKRLAKTLILAWNFAGLITLAIVVFIINSSLYFPAIWHAKETFSIQGFGSFPFTFLAGFMMPLAVFLHIFSIVKTIKE